MLEVEIKELKIADYEEVITLWENCQGIHLRDADSRENIERYLHHNPGLSSIAYHNSKIVGAVLYGHSGAPRLSQPPSCFTRLP